METYKIGKFHHPEWIWGRWADARVWWVYRGGASSRTPFV